MTRGRAPALFSLRAHVSPTAQLETSGQEGYHHSTMTDVTTDGSACASPTPSDTMHAYQAAISSFLHATGNFESTLVLDELDAALDAAFEAGASMASIPLKHKLLNMAGAINWAFFLSTSASEAPETANEFSADEAFATIGEVYDRGVEEAVWAHFEADEEDDEDEEEEGEEATE